MACTVIGNAIVCSRGRKPKPCFYCREPSAFLCDGALDGSTCDRPMCAKCATQVGPNLHYCRAHREMPGATERLL